MSDELIYDAFEYGNSVKFGQITGQKLIMAVKRRDIQEVKRLLNLPIDKGGLLLVRLTAKDEQGKTAKDYANESGVSEIIKLFN